MTVQPAPRSTESHLSIGEVLDELRDEFPDITISKIRFLESQGLIDPERTPSGYRKFYGPDLERLRWILLQQRDHFLPLRVIKERLDAFGPAGAPGSESGAESRTAAPATPNGPAPTRAPAAPPPAPTPAPDSPITEAARALPVGDESESLGPIQRPDSTPASIGLTRAELIEASGLSAAILESLESFGLIEPLPGDGEKRYGDDALTVAELSVEYAKRGIEARHLKMYHHFAEREAGLFAQVLLPYQRQRNPAARARLQEELEELARLGRRLRTVMLLRALRHELSE
jgi:DNA-binding transcriptional MerR regulator